MQKVSEPSRGFSLVEVLVVIAIMVVLMGLLIPSIWPSGDFADRVSLRKITPQWTGADLGAVQVPGLSSQIDGTWTVQAAGYNISGTQDQGRFVYTTLTGNFEVTARVLMIDSIHSWAKAGVMIRNSLETGSTMAFCAMTPPTNRSCVFYRRLSDGASTSGNSDTEVTLPQWVKLVRISDMITAYHSSDGQNWDQVGSGVTVGFNEEVLVGLAYVSRMESVLGTAVFDNLTIEVNQ